MGTDNRAGQQSSPELIVNKYPETMREALDKELFAASGADFSVAFITSDGLAMLKQALLNVQGRVRIVTSDYLGFNSPEIFWDLLSNPNVEAYVYAESGRGFHPKGYVFRSGNQTVTIIGSSNLTVNALVRNEEWNLRISSPADGEIASQVEAAIADQIEKSISLTREWIEAYEKKWAGLQERLRIEPAEDPDKRSDVEVIQPNEMQVRALASLKRTVSEGARRALIISATGTGKTILAALTVRQQAPRRILFVVHREQILDKAIEEFQKVLDEPSSAFGKFTGTSKDLNAKYLFATIQTISKPSNLHQFGPDDFDQIIIDEVHRSGAGSYLSVIDYFEPRLLLGLTATPERTDGFNIYEIFDYNTVFEIRLGDAMDQGMVVPFHYYGVRDYTDLDGNSVSETADLARLVVDQRVDHLVESLEVYGFKTGVRGLIFCSRNDEANELAQQLNLRSVAGRTLRTMPLSGATSMSEREDAVTKLNDGGLDYLVTVDIFNEGVDIPAVNQVVMLRPTQSAIVFTQQLGRGLRKSAGKSHLRVIDFIGNYKNNFMIPIALFNDTSASRDSLRRRTVENQLSGIDPTEDSADQIGRSAACVSSVNFDPIARKRVLDSINTAKLDSIHVLKQAVSEMRNRLGNTPMLIDFAKTDYLDAVVVANKATDYWTLLSKFKLVDEGPTPEMAQILRFLTAELLNGKRPDELKLLKSILRDGDRENSWVEDQLQNLDEDSRGQRLRSVKSVLSLDFYTDRERAVYGDQPFIRAEGSQITAGERLSGLYSNDSTFRKFVDDILDTGLFYSQARYDSSSQLLPGKTYSRKDATRLLDWETSNYQTVYGYKTDSETETCPIFVTYHKDEEVSDSTRYGDAFIDRKHFRWFSRSRRTLDSKEIIPIVNNNVELHVFVKRDDSEGIDFFYLGKARCVEAKNAKIPDSERGHLNIVEMLLEFEEEVPIMIYDHLTAAVG